jgi:transposase
MNTKLLEVAGRRRRRKHSAEFKLSAAQACQRAGASIAAVALANGLNANMLRKWVIEAERARAGELATTTVVPEDTGAAQSVPSPGFIELPVPESSSGSQIHIELQRSGTTVKVNWPVSAASECGVWLRALLR